MTFKIFIKYILLSMFFSLSSYGQDYINKEIDTYYLFRNMQSPVIYEFDLVTRSADNNPKIESLTLTKEQKVRLSDSLSHLGFQDKFDLYDISKNFQYTLTISNYKFFLTNEQKEVFYKVTISIKFTRKGSEDKTFICGEFTTKKTQYEIVNLLKTIKVDFRRIDKSNLCYLKFNADSFFDIPLHGARKIGPCTSKIYFFK